jgi:rhomboid protease GluP
MANSDDDILVREAAKMAGGWLGAGFAAQFLPTETHTEKLALKIAPEKALKLGFAALTKLGKLTEEDINPPPYPMLSAVVWSGFLNMNPAIVHLEIHKGDSTECELTITASAKEGLIKQHAASKAVQRVVLELRKIATAPEKASVRLTDFGWPWVTFALLAVLVIVFGLEDAFAVVPGRGLDPTVGTLFVLGGLSRTAVLSGGEWYRLFTAPLLHANVGHVVFNCVALLLGGRLLERLIGHLWFLVYFMIGALGGSLMSLALTPANIVSVGASGALMGIFAGLLVCSFRLPSWSQERPRILIGSLLVLIASLFPLFRTTATIHIDYGAHIGGAITGAALGLLLLKSWDGQIPQMRKLGTGLSIAGIILFATSAGLVAANHPRSKFVLIPQAQVPKTTLERRADTATLVDRYPDDPRSHIYLAEALLAGRDAEGAERELRVALAKAEALTPALGPEIESPARTALAKFLLDQGRRTEAKAIAGPQCSIVPGDHDTRQRLKLLSAEHLCD